MTKTISSTAPASAERPANEQQATSDRDGGKTEAPPKAPVYADKALMTTPRRKDYVVKG